MKSLSPSAFPAFGGILPLALCALTQILPAAPGDPDLTFGTNGVVSGIYYSIGLQSDGKIVAVSGQSVLRFLPNGSADTAFAGATGEADIPFPASAHERALAVLPDGKIFVTGTQAEDIALLRLNADGTPDNTFGTGGVKLFNVATYTPPGFDPHSPPPQPRKSVDTGVGVLPLPNGNFAVAGTTNQVFAMNSGVRMVICIFDASGNLVTYQRSIDYRPDATVEDFAVLPGGVDVFVLVNDSADFRYIYHPLSPMEGAAIRDITGGPVGFNDRAYGVAVRPDGSVLLTGDAAASGGFLGGLSSAGGWQYDTPKVYGPSFPVQKSIVLQPDGRIVTGGEQLMRFMPDGNLDPSFRTVNPVSGIKTLVLHSDGKILTAGDALRRFEGTSVSATMAVEFPEGIPFDGGGSAPVDYGIVSAGASAAKTFTVRNTSALPLQLWKTELEGASTSVITTDKTFPLTIAPGASTTVTVQWAPIAPGALNGVLHLINSDTTKRSFDIYLTGTSPAPNPEIEVRLDGTAAADGRAVVHHPAQSVSPARRPHVFECGKSAAELHAGANRRRRHGLQLTPHRCPPRSPRPPRTPPPSSTCRVMRRCPPCCISAAMMRTKIRSTSAITGDPSTSSATWRDSWFSGAPPGAPTGDTQDYDGDGVPNILEYATFGNPVEPAGIDATLVKKGNLLEYTLTRPLEASTELLYELEWTDSLTAGPWKTLGTSATVTSQDDIRQQVKFTVASGTGHRYVRLKVTRVP